MDLDVLTRIAAAVAVLGTAVVYGTDMFCAIVLRPALAAVDDDVLVTVTGLTHKYGDRRMPVPGMLGVLAGAACAVLAALNGRAAQASSAGIAVLLLLAWLTIYTRVSAPINRQLTAAAISGEHLSNGRALQANWDRVINARAALQGLAVAALCVALAI
ncbi:DUF1772 domain-containing protein [Mycobacterium sp. ENV421]|uniref:DUF1772 domain-containing protein n=1 Tax=Mycobacterium sp. ENV421 TaxID=1213407 RepID=UPI000C9C6902|nr:DUF1772 domain-containing protein [Mycobacterium sp. ENV421]PND59601.1 DUF1772 domain-containing protein [Mycobacterium sp. ENV421]